MFKDWTWQKWAGKIILLILAIIAFIVKEFGADIPLWMIILPAATQVAQWLLALIPGMGWQVILGQVLLLIIAVGETVLGGLGLSFEMWLLLVPLVGALAQYLISKVPN
jgi:hypothetical protein